MVTKKSRLWTLAALTVAVTGFSSCLKNSNPEPQKPVTYVAFVNSLATTFGSDIFLDGTKITTKEIKFGEAAGQVFNPKSYKFDFKKYGADSLLATVTAVFDTSAYNTLILYGDKNDGAHIHRIRENWANPATDKANVRFFNLMPESPAVDLFIGGNKVFSSRQYEDFVTGQYDNFTATPEGSQVMVAKDAAGTEIAIDNNSVTLVRGGFYNIYLQGVKGTTTGDLKPRIRIMAYQ